MKVAAAVSELENVYGDQVDFVIVPAEETARRPEEIEAYGFTEKRHGLVAFTSDGEACIKMPGHDFTRLEIESAVHRLLMP